MRLRHVAFLCLIALTPCGCGGDKPAPGPAAPAAAPGKREPLVPKAVIHDWCKEHTVPESICTRCNESLIPGFKQKGDWCAKHGLPDSQCFECHPELKAKFEAMAPKDGK
ncbi:MAG: hypothetical protein WAT39_13145 [Planctomycetota bacterium]